MTDTPPGWVMTTVGKVFEVVGGGTPDTTVDAFWTGTTPWISSADISAEGVISIRRKITSEAITHSAASRVPADSVIVVTRVGLGKVARASEPIAFSQDCQALLPISGMNPDFLRLQLSSTAQAFKYQSRGTTISGVTKRQLLDLPLFVPPTAEQVRIVAAIEQQFTRLDAAVAALERARQNINHMKSALLRDSWDAAMEAAGGLSQVVDLLESPLANGRSVPDGPPDGFPVLRLTCVRDGIIDDTETKAGAWTAQQAEQYLVREGDFLVVRGNGSRHLVGRGGIVIRDAAVAYPDTLIRIRPHSNRLTTRFLGLLWNSASVRVQLENSARTTAGIYKINQQSLGRIELPVPAPEIQANILRDADRDLSRSHLLDAEIANALGRTSRLRSAILLAAFSGKLVPHDPSDERASVLLERIHAERGRSNGHEAAVDRKPRTRRRRVPA